MTDPGLKQDLTRCCSGPRDGLTGPQLRCCCGRGPSSLPRLHSETSRCSDRRRLCPSRCPAAGPPLCTDRVRVWIWFDRDENRRRIRALTPSRSSSSSCSVTGDIYRPLLLECGRSTKIHKEMSIWHISGWTVKSTVCLRPRQVHYTEHTKYTIIKYISIKHKMKKSCSGSINKAQSRKSWSNRIKKKYIKCNSNI